MNANELMLEDWVYAKVQVDDTGTEPVYETIPKRVSELSRVINGIYVEDTSTFAGADILPIPLTPEILENSGWKCAKGGTMMGVMHIADRYDLTIKNENNGTKWWIYVEDDGETEPRRWTIQVQGSFNILGHIGYVHELQHALRLAGIKKEIVL